MGGGGAFQIEINFIPILRPIQNASVRSWYFRNEYNQRHLVWFYGLERFWKAIRYDLDKNNGGPDTEAALGEYTSCLLSFKPLIMFLERKQGDLLGAAELCARGQVQTVEPASTSPAAHRQLHRLGRTFLAPGQQQTRPRL